MAYHGINSVVAPSTDFSKDHWEINGRKKAMLLYHQLVNKLVETLTICYSFNIQQLLQCIVMCRQIQRR